MLASLGVTRCVTASSVGTSDICKSFPAKLKVAFGGIPSMTGNFVSLVSKPVLRGCCASVVAPAIIPNSKIKLFLAHQDQLWAFERPKENNQIPPFDIPCLVCLLNEKENTMQIYRFFKKYQLVLWTYTPNNKRFNLCMLIITLFLFPCFVFLTLQWLSLF